MKINYKKKRLYSNLVIGLIWLTLGVFRFIENDTIRWIDSMYLVVGFLYLGNYLNNQINQYLTIENGTIKKNSIFEKKMVLNEITLIKKFADEYTLITENKTLTINTNLIEDKSLSQLLERLQELNLPADKTPFSSND